MLKRQKDHGWILWLFWLLVALDFFVGLLRTCPPSEQQKAGECSEKYYGFLNTFSYSIFGWIELHHDFVIAAATVAIAWFTLTLRNSTEKMWLAGERHSERELRAYIVIKEITVLKATPGNCPEIIILYENSGKTPAYEIAVAAESGMITWPPARLPPVDRTPEHGSVSLLGGSGTHRIRLTLDGVLSNNQFIALRDGTLAIHVLGTITYWDAFRRVQRYTNFNAFYGGPQGIDPTGAASHADRGNDAN
ncbi:MAG TPA: hypothetical protein VFA57_16995 [Pseudolabrys sp.]|nr:hypothetical protein [Pseudolabrys sp.]